MQMDPKRYHRIILIIVAAGLVLRLLNLVAFSALPVSNVMILDSGAYDTMAKTIVFGEGMPSEPYFQSPLYPYFLAGLYSLFGVNYSVVRFIQILLDT